MFSSICTWINGWVNTREAGDLRLYLTHYDVTVMGYPSFTHFEPYSCEICSAQKLFINCSVWLSLAKRTNEVPHISSTWSSTISPQFYLVLGFFCQCVIKPIILARNQCENERLTWRVKLQYIPRNMHTDFALLCFVVVKHWLVFPYPLGLLHWHCGNLTIAPVPAKQPWSIWINISFEFIMNDYITTTKQSTTKPCAYFLGYTVDIPPHRVVGTQHGLTHFSGAQFTKSMNFSLCRTAHLPGNISNDNNAVWLEIAFPTSIFSFAIVM